MRHEDRTDTEFLDYIEERYPEHFRRITRAQAVARSARISYPLMGFLLTSVPGVAICIILEVLKASSASQAGFLPPEAAPMLGSVAILFWVLTALVVGVTTTISFLAGIQKAQSVLFESEQLEIATRVQYELRGLRAFFPAEQAQGKERVAGKGAEGAVVDVRIPGPH